MQITSRQRDLFFCSKILLNNFSAIFLRVLSNSPQMTENNGTVQTATGSAEEKMDHFPHFGTLAIHAGQEPEQWNSRAVVPPISMATTFKQDSPGVYQVDFVSMDKLKKVQNI